MAEGAPQPFFFGPAEARKFGCLDLPVEDDPRRAAVVICPPFGHEYVRAHRAFRRLAVRLAEDGFAVLRFDYSGCGDSAGGEELADLAAWVDDAAQAVEAVRQRTSATSICLIGGRLGASIAWRVATNRADVTDLVLWDPVIDGQDELRHLERAHRKMIASAHVTEKEPRPAGEIDSELLGFGLPGRLRRGLEQLDLSAEPVPGVREALIVDSSDGGAAETLARRLATTGARVSRHQAEGEQPWSWVADVARAVLPVQVIESVAAWVDENCA